MRRSHVHDIRFILLCTQAEVLPTCPTIFFLDYGASLALERRLKLVEEGNNAGTNPQFPAIEI
jgi:hypothetical protein